MSPVVLAISEGALFLLSMMDGHSTLAEIAAQLEARSSRKLPDGALASLVGQLDQALFLEGPKFEEHYSALQNAYRNRGVRAMPHASELGIVDASGSIFKDMLQGVEARALGGAIQGLIVPHLDYERGRPCYAAGYSTLRNRNAPDRVVILGTNHFGRSTSVVGTACAFETPLGTTAVDRELLWGLEAECGSLTEFELDHAREHSIELQVAWLQHIFGAENFEMLAFLCPDPCGPTGTSPFDGHGVDLRVFADALRSLLNDGNDTLLIAGADFSHVGQAFAADPVLDEGFLDTVGRRDREAIEWLGLSNPEKFIACVAADDNSTRICSMGCMYVLATLLPQAKVTQLGYHQAVDHESQTCVTCAALAYTSTS